ATGRWGCSHCYTVFEPAMRELLRRVHGNPKHAGRRYEPPAPALDANATILGELKDRLRRAIESEQFEVAADLRDKIRVIE
ncbi:MAG TPA: UvrB/UvrC motif-containing protein, partial [Gemmatimonadaceae bacterium]